MPTSQEVDNFPSETMASINSHFALVTRRNLAILHFFLKIICFYMLIAITIIVFNIFASISEKNNCYCRKQKKLVDIFPVTKRCIIVQKKHLERNFLVYLASTFGKVCYFFS